MYRSRSRCRTPAGPPRVRCRSTSPSPSEDRSSGSAQWYADPDEFAREQSPGDEARAARAIVDLRLFEAGAGAAVSGIVEHAERVSSSLVGDVMTLVVRTIVDIPVVVWCAPGADPPPPGSVFDGVVAVSGFSHQLV